MFDAAAAVPVVDVEVKTDEVGGGEDVNDLVKAIDEGEDGEEAIADEYVVGDEDGE